MNYWFVRSPYKTRKWEDVLMAGVFKLYGIRGYAAKKNISQMRKGDIVLWYSSTAGKSVFGVMKVKGKAYQDPTTKDKWLSIDFISVKTFKKKVSFENMAKNKILKEACIIKQKRISVVSIKLKEYEEILRLQNKEINKNK